MLKRYSFFANGEKAEGLTTWLSSPPPPLPPLPPHQQTLSLGKKVKANVSCSSPLSKRVDRFGFCCTFDKEPKKITETALSRFDLVLDAYLFGLRDEISCLKQLNRARVGNHILKVCHFKLKLN